MPTVAVSCVHVRWDCHMGVEEGREGVATAGAKPDRIGNVQKEGGGEEVDETKRGGKGPGSRTGPAWEGEGM